mmetsp:Transcript_24803/g.62782  ORF Transcript_24803/g.62782 Transcript_24803/m.62782 type:complete len:134 (+) Transcript_24803:564-965(+)
MDESELRQFTAGVASLRAQLIALCELVLLHCARSAVADSRQEQRAWATAALFVDRTCQCPRPLTQQPGSIEMSPAYAAAVSDPHLVIYKGAPEGNPTQVLDFPLSRALPITRLYRQLFGFDCSSFIWMRAVEW